MPIYALGEYEPDIHETAFVHPDAVVTWRAAWWGTGLRGLPGAAGRPGGRRAREDQEDRGARDWVEGAVKTYIETGRAHRAGLRRLDRDL